MTKVLVALEMDVDPFELAAALDVDLAGSVDHDLGDRRVQQERFDRAKAGDLVEHDVDEPIALAAGHARPLLERQPVEDHREREADVLGALEGEERRPVVDRLVLQAQVELAQHLIA